MKNITPLPFCSSFLVFPSSVVPLIEFRNSNNAVMDHSSRHSPRKTRAPPLKIKRRPISPNDAQILLQDKKILFALACIRIFNALTIRTFFQPDEYYQSLEPAWKFVYGYGESWLDLQVLAKPEPCPPARLWCLGPK